MTKEELIELKKQLSTLTEEEQKERDLYLRGLANGEIQGPPVGYPSIDKPWLRYYSEKHVKAELPHMTCYELLKKNAEKNPNSIAIEYLGNKISYSSLLNHIADVAKAYKKLGIKKGDIVSFLMVNTPEMVYSFYALNMLGAIPNMIDPRSNEQGLKKYLDEVNSTILVSIDACCPDVENIVNNTSIKKVVVLPATNSASFPIKAVSNVMSCLKKENKEGKKNDNIIYWSEFIKQAQKDEQVMPVKYEKNLPAAIVHTGGTTGLPKGVLLSNDNFNAVVHQVVNSPIPMQEKDKFLNILVPFVAYGLALGMHAPMCLGWDSILIPKFSPSDIVKLMSKHKPAGVMGIATYYEPLLGSDKYDFSNTKVMLMGGMPTKAEFEQRINDKIRQDNGHFNVSKGYSMTEASSCATCSFDMANELGSNGVPLVKTIISSFDPITGEEKQNGELGEICIYSPTAMINYFKNPEESSKVLRQHEDGKIWIHSGDLGYVTDDGLVYIVDRIKRMIIRSGFKVFPSEIENAILQHPAISSCAVVGIDDEKDDKAPIAYVVLKDGFRCIQDDIISELHNYLENNGLPPYFEPVSYELTDSLPLTNIGKIDYAMLEKEANTRLKKIKKVKNT